MTTMKNDNANDGNGNDKHQQRQRQWQQRQSSTTTATATATQRQQHKQQRIQSRRPKAVVAPPIPSWPLQWGPASGSMADAARGVSLSDFGGDDAASETGNTVGTLKNTPTLCALDCPCRDPRWGTLPCKFCRRPRRSPSTLQGRGPHMPWRRERGRECGICPWVIDGDATLSALLFFFSTS